MVGRMAHAFGKFDLRYLRRMVLEPKSAAAVRGRTGSVWMYLCTAQAAFFQCFYFFCRFGWSKMWYVAADK